MKEADNKELPNLPEKQQLTTNKELPIAARLKGPGPAAYTLPTYKKLNRTIGYQAKNGKRAPAYSFGMKLPVKLDENTPGPNKFFPQTTRTGPSKGPAFSLRGGFTKREFPDKNDQNTPSPATYNPVYIPTKEQKAPAYSISPRRIPQDSNTSPAPAQYNIKPTIGHDTVVTVPAAPSYSMKPLRPIKQDYVSPGPAAHNPVTITKIKSSTPAYSLGRRLLKSKTEAPTPGPDVPKAGFARHNLPKFSFRSKHSEYELFVPDMVGCEFHIE